MPKMRVIERHDWNQKRVHPGDEYEATENEARLLEGLGWSVRVESLQPQRRHYRRRDVTAQP